MSTLDKIYQKFENLEEQYLCSEQSRSDFIAERFGQDLEVGITILTDAILKENPSETKEIEKFSYLKDLFSFLLKHKDSMESLSSFETMTEEVSDMQDILSKLSLTITKPCTPSVTSQKELYEKTGALHYEVTPDSISYVSLNQCHAFYVSNENFAVLLKTVNDVSSNLKRNTVYVNGKRGLRQCRKSEILPYLTSVCGD